MSGKDNLFIYSFILFKSLYSLWCIIASSAEEGIRSAEIIKISVQQGSNGMTIKSVFISFPVTLFLVVVFVI